MAYNYITIRARNISILQNYIHVIPIIRIFSPIFFHFLKKHATFAWFAILPTHPPCMHVVLIRIRTLRDWLIVKSHRRWLRTSEWANEDVRAVRFSCCVGGRVFAGREGLRASALVIRARSTARIRVDNNLLIELKKRKDERALSDLALQFSTGTNT